MALLLTAKGEIPPLLQLMEHQGSKSRTEKPASHAFLQEISPQLPLTGPWQSSFPGNGGGRSAPAATGSADGYDPPLCGCHNAKHAKTKRNANSAFTVTVTSLRQERVNHHHQVPFNSYGTRGWRLQHQGLKRYHKGPYSTCQERHIHTSPVALGSSKVSWLWLITSKSQQRKTNTSPSKPSATLAYNRQSGQEACLVPVVATLNLDTYRPLWSLLLKTRIY